MLYPAPGGSKKRCQGSTKEERGGTREEKGCIKEEKSKGTPMEDVKRMMREDRGGMLFVPCFSATN